MRVTMIPIVLGTLRAVPKSLEKRLEVLEIRGRMKTIPTKALLRSARILRRVQEIRDLQSPRLQCKTISWGWCEKLARSNIVYLWCGKYQLYNSAKKSITYSIPRRTESMPQGNKRNLLYIDQLFLKEGKAKRKNVAMA